jgi:hypothetical protein
MEVPIRASTVAAGRRIVATNGKGDLAMHPTISYELARIKIAEELEYAARARLARDAVGDRPRSIDFSSLGQRLRIRIFGGPALGGTPTATAGA